MDTILELFFEKLFEVEKNCTNKNLLNIVERKILFSNITLTQLIYEKKIDELEKELLKLWLKLN
jgi:hypothetical protein